MIYSLYIYTPFINQEAIDTNTIKPLMVPDSVVFTFDTIGWSVALWIGVALVLAFSIWSTNHYIKNKYKRDALKILDGLTADGSPEVNQYIAAQLKLVAIKSYGREVVSHLSGKEWTSFLHSKVKHAEFKNLDSFLTLSLYQNKEDVLQTKQFLTFSKKWIKTHA